MFTLEVPGCAQGMAVTSAGTVGNDKQAMQLEYMAELGLLEGVRFWYEFQAETGSSRGEALGVSVHASEFLRVLLKYLHNPVGRGLPPGVQCHPDDVGLLHARLDTAEAQDL